MASIEDLHDRLAKAQDVLVDLRQMIDRLAGNSSSASIDHRRSSSTSSLPNFNTTISSIPSTPDDLFFYLDKEAADDLVNDINDTLRDAEDDYELLREDAVDLGIIAADPIGHPNIDGHDEEPPVDTAMSGVNRTLRPFAATLRSSSAHSNGMSSSFTEDDASSTSTSIDSHRLRRSITRLDESLGDARKAFRAAQLAAHRHRETAQREQHRQVLASYVEEESDSEDEPERDDGEDTTTEKTARSTSRTRLAPLAKHTSPTTSAAADVTAALRQTHARIAGEVARSDFAAQTLAESSRALAELGDKYGGGGSTGAGGGGDIGSSLKSARTLVKGLVAAHKSDTWYLQTALYMVVATIGWLLFRRILYGPLWLLVWWPLRTVFGTAAWVGKTGASVAGAGGGKQGSLSVSESPLASVVTSIATTSVAAEVYATESAQTQATPSESLVEQVGRMVEESATGSNAAPTGEAGGSASEEAVQPNPKKRMWEEPVEAAKYEAQQQKEREEKEKAEQEAKGKGKESAEGERKKDEL